jgi:hypothetical protein
MADTSTPGSILPGGIVLIDEPAHCNVTTFADIVGYVDATGPGPPAARRSEPGDVLLTFNTRPGGNCGQVIIGLSPSQTLTLIERLQMHSEHCRKAVAEGRGGATFPAAT